MKLDLPDSFPTSVHVLKHPDASLLPKGPWVLVGDEAVRPSWEGAGMPVPTGSRWVHIGESTKRLETLLPWLETWAELPLYRDACIVAVGGGVLTDLCGLAAALFLRGVAWQAWPTTLLAQVDAGLGGKTAANLAAGKNLVGAFHPPKRMVVCSDFLETLPLHQLNSGRWELIKLALVEGDTLWAEHLLEQTKPCSRDLAKALHLKAELVHHDLRDMGDRKLLNLGHTLGHALEAASNFRLLHGEAVGLGLLAACFLAEQQGLPSFSLPLLRRLSRELKPLAKEIPAWEECLPWLRRDKKIGMDSKGTIPAVHCVLPRPGDRAVLRFLPPDAWGAAHAKLLASLS